MDILVAGEGILVVAQAGVAEEDTPAEEGGIMVMVVEAEDIMGTEAVMGGEADKEEGGILIKGCRCLPNPQ